MADLFYALIFIPLYNALILFVDLLPGYDVGIAVVLLTIMVKLLLFPLSIKAVRTQLLMREIEEPMKKIREKFKDDRQKQGEEMLALYREKGVNPFSSILLLLIQIPIIFGLYWVFYKGGLPEIQVDLLYSFIPIPARVDMLFLGLIDMAGKSAVLALLAGLSQFFQAKLSLPPLDPNPEKGFRGEFARSMHLNMKYVLPIIVTVISYSISAAIALYWLTSNLFTIGQELYVRRRIKPTFEKKATEV
jgi:YidC/Oxa1 family membrane protein insertase